MIEWSSKRKRITMLVTVSVPRNMVAAHARREVKCLISDGAGFFTYAGEAVKCISAKAART